MTGASFSAITAIGALASILVARKWHRKFVRIRLMMMLLFLDAVSSVFGIIEHASEYKSRIREIYPSALWSANPSAVETPPAVTQISAFLRLSFFNASLVWTAIIAYHMVRFHLSVNGLSNLPFTR